MNKSNEWETPQTLFDELDREFHFTLDPASTDENAKCLKHYTMKDDGLSKSWKGERVFLNPPYGREIPKWVEKAFHEFSGGVEPIVLLIPARTDTAYWHEYIFGKAEIRFIRGRIKFGDAHEGAPFPSAIVIYRSKKNDS